jgi:hypothetical protein
VSLLKEQNEQARAERFITTSLETKIKRMFSTERGNDKRIFQVFLIYGGCVF